MSAIYVTICSLVILLGFEIRYRVMTEEIAALKISISSLKKEVLRLNEEMKLKKNAFEEHRPLTQQ